MEVTMSSHKQMICVAACLALMGTVAVASGAVLEQTAPNQQPAGKPLVVPIEYVIGPDDVLTITVDGQDPTLHSGDVVVRPDGKISRPLIDEIQASGLTLLELKAELTKAYAKFFKDPVILISPKQINSRKVGITGNVNKPGEYSLRYPMDLLQLLTKAGGLTPYADKENIHIIRRHADGKIETIVFNYMEVFQGKGVTQVPQLKPGDQVIVK
jgi:polysaccharide biosynthesis/export protein